MGTSQSSKGSPGGIPMVPPWTPEPPTAFPPSPPEEIVSPGGDNPSPPLTPPIPLAPIPIAPTGRFSNPRRNLGDFARTADSRKMRRGIGQYSRESYGGGRTAARRLAATSRTAQTLYNSLGNIARGQAAFQGSNLDPVLLQGKSASEIIDAVVDAIRPVDGTLDSESGRESVRDSLSDLLDVYPDANILSLTEIEKLFVVQRFVSNEIYHRLDLDVGQHIRNKAPNYLQALDRLREVKEYIQASVGTSFNRFQQNGRELRNSDVESLVQSILVETFNIFEEYL